MVLKKILQEKLARYANVLSTVNEVCAIYLVDIENGKYVKKIYKYTMKEEQYTALLQKASVLFTDSTIGQAVLETTEFNMALRKVNDTLCFVLISEKKLTFGKIVTIIKQCISNEEKA